MLQFGHLLTKVAHVWEDFQENRAEIAQIAKQMYL